MQRLVSLKLSSSLTKKFSDSTTSALLHSQPHTSFASLAKPAPTHTPNHFFSSSLANPFPHYSHSWGSYHSLSKKIHGFFFDTPLLKQLLLNSPNTFLRASRTYLTDSRVGFFKALFPKQRFDLNSTFSYNRRSWKSWFQGMSSDDVVLGLIIANVAVFLLWKMVDYQFMMKNFTISVDNVRSGRLHTLITSAFSHKDIEHIISNMIGLYFFGTNVGRNFGPQYLLKLYLAGAVGGSVFFLLHHIFLASQTKGRNVWSDPSKMPGLGASGAVNAILLLDIFLFPKATLYFDFIIPVPAILLGIFLIGKDFLRMIEGDPNISGSAHIGGAAVAAMAWLQLRKGRF